MTDFAVSDCSTCMSTVRFMHSTNWLVGQLFRPCTLWYIVWNLDATWDLNYIRYLNVAPYPQWLTVVMLIPLLFKYMQMCNRFKRTLNKSGDDNRYNFHFGFSLDVQNSLKSKIVIYQKTGGDLMVALYFSIICS